ncbi:DsbA family protein [Arenibacterium sp. CAU 1754]
MMDRAQPGATAVDALVSSANAQETDAAEVDTSSIVDMAIGDENAPVTIIEYASYTCPHCATFHQGPFKKLKADYIDTGKVRFIYREVYFDRYGLWASMIARCGGPEKFFGITDLIFAGQSTWARAGGAPEIVGELRKIGRLAGIEKDALEACLQDSENAQTLVAWYQANAEADGVTATPSFVMNGRKVENQNYEDFAKLIEEELGN